MRNVRPRLAAGLAALALLTTVAGCDTALPGGERTFLQPRDVTFTVVYSDDGFTAGRAVTVASTGTVGLAGRLDGFRPADIVAAEVTAVRVTRRTPAGTNLSVMMQNVTASLTAGSTTRPVGTAATLPAASTGALTPSGNDVATLLVGGATGLQLAFTPPAVRQDDYTLDVTLTLAIEVGGL